MAGVTLGFLKFVLGFDSLAFQEGASNADKQLRTLQRRFEATAERISNFGQQATIALTLPIAAIATAAVRGAQEQAAAMAQVEAALASMGSGAGRTAEQLSAAADRMELNSLYNADVILKDVTANLLTFGNIAGSEFDRAQQAVIDLSTRMGGDLVGATVRIGRALNDPIAGLTVLTRNGIKFTESQQAAVRAMVAMGDTAGAQRVILAELERQFENSAARAAAADPWRRAQVAIDQAMDKIGEAILPVIPPIADAIATLAQRFGALSPEAQKNIIIFGGIAAAIGPVALAIGGIVSAMAPLSAAFAATKGLLAGLGAAASTAGTGFLGLTAAALPWIALGAGIAAAAYAIYENWDKIGPALSETADMLKAELGPVFTDTFNRIKETVIALWEGPFGEALRTAGANLMELGSTIGSVLGPVALSVLRGFASLFGTVFETIGNILNTLISLLSGDFTGAWAGVQATVGGIIRGLFRLVEAVFPGIGEYAYNLYLGLKTWLQDRMTAVWNWVIDKIETVKNAFFTLYDAVVGNSYIPDMVDEIGDTMRRLDGELVRPAQQATQSAADAFATLDRDVGAIMDRLFPDRARTNEFISDMERLDAALRGRRISRLEYQEARARLYEELQGGRVTGAPAMAREMDLTIPEVRIDVPEGEDIGRDLMREWGYVADEMEAQNVRIVESFAQLAQGALSEIDKLVKGIRSGNVIDMLSGLLGALDKIGGLFGGFNLGPLKFGGARAMGGPVSAGKSYLVGERGPELVTFGRSGMVTPNHRMGGGNITVHVNAQDAVLADTVRGWVAEGIRQATGQGAALGSQLAQAAMARSQSRVPA